MLITRGMVLLIGLLIFWQLIIFIFQLPPYILPSPLLVYRAFISQFSVIAAQTWPTVVETILGLIFGSLIGVIGALNMSYFQPVRFWMMPVLIVSQAIPTFAIAPLLVIWFGYGMTAKIVTAMLMIFFPVTSYFYDGLRRTDPNWLDLATTMNGSRWRTLWHLRIPAALPALASGLRVATVIAPIGAVIGEWVGSSRGLGFLMLNANARMEIDTMFAALFTLVIFSLLLFFTVDKLLHRVIYWQTEK